MKFGNIPKKIFFFRNYAENEAGKLFQTTFCFSKKLDIR